jgi:hypothetical protein
MTRRTASFVLLLAATFLALAGDPEHAQDLHAEHCIACHGTEVYTREARKVTSLPGLERQVQRCELALGLRWFDEDIDDMTTFLNEHFYHFHP